MSITGIILGIIAVLAAIYTSLKTKEKKVNNSKVPAAVKNWEPEVRAAAKEFDVPFSIAMSVLWTESAGNDHARGSAGEVGLMQLKEIAVKDLQLKNLGKFKGWKYKPEQNIRAGVAYLRLQFNNTGNWFEAVKAYNQGLQGKEEHPEKAQNYLEKVRSKEKFFQ